MMRSMRVYSRRVYRNTLAFGAALLIGWVGLLIADIWFLAGVPGLLRTIIGFIDAILLLLGAAYVLTGFYGLARAKE